MNLKFLSLLVCISFGIWSGVASASPTVALPIATMMKMNRSQLVQTAFEKGWMPSQCSEQLDFYNLPLSSVPAYLRQGLFVSKNWAFPCLSSITKNPTTKSPEQNYLTLLFTKLACAAVPENSLYFPELLFCRDAQWPNGCVVGENPAQCLEQFTLTLEKNVQWLRKYSPTVYATLTGKPTLAKIESTAFGPQLPPRVVNPASNEPTRPSIQPSLFEIETFQQRLSLAEELISNPRVRGEQPAPLIVEAEVKPEEVDLSDEVKTPAPVPTPKAPTKPAATVKKLAPVLTPKEIRFKKYLDPVPEWAKKVHTAAIKALTAPGYIRAPGYCSAWVREVFQSAFPSQAMPLDYYYFGPSAAGWSRRGILRGSTLGMWLANGRVKPYSQVGRKGLRAGDVVFQSYGFNNAGHIGIVVVNSAFPVKNKMGVKVTDDLVIAENTQRHCRWPKTLVGCPRDNRGVVSIERFGDITHVGRFNGWAK